MGRKLPCWAVPIPKYPKTRCSALQVNLNTYQRFVVLYWFVNASASRFPTLLIPGQAHHYPSFRLPRLVIPAPPLVIPAQAGIRLQSILNTIPAVAGMMEL